MCEHVHAQPPLGAVCGAARCQSAQAGRDEGADTDGRDMDGRGRHGWRGQTRALHFGSQGSGGTRLGVSTMCVAHTGGFEACERGLWRFQAASGVLFCLGGTLHAAPGGLQAGDAPVPGPCWWPAAARRDGEVAAPWARHNASCGDGQPRLSLHFLSAFCVNLPGEAPSSSVQDALSLLLD